MSSLDLLQPVWRYLYPVAASTHATKVDHLMAFLLGAVAFFSISIASTILFFIVRYHHSRKRPRKPEPKQPVVGLIEVTWTGGALVLCAVMFLWAASLYVEGAVYPADAEEVLVVGKQWMWKVQHEGGAREIDELHVPVGRDVKLVMTSQDVIHSFYVPEFRVKEDVLPRRYTYLWFRATRPGVYHLFCAEYCGTQHSRMRGRVVAMEAAEYARWLEAAQAQTVSAREAGRQLFAEFGCVACHRSENANRAPPLEGVFGSRVLLEGGAEVTADEEYLRESIVAPAAKVVAGYTPIMPDFSKSLTDMEVMELVTYVKSLGQRREAAPETGVFHEEP